MLEPINFVESGLFALSLHVAVPVATWEKLKRKQNDLSNE